MPRSSLGNVSGSGAHLIRAAILAIGLGLLGSAPRNAHAQEIAALDSRPLFTIEAPAPEAGVSRGARALSVGPDGSVYIADTGHGRIQRFDGDGAFLGAWGETGAAEGRFLTSSSSLDLAVGPDGSIWTSELRPGPNGWCNHRIQRFDADGVFREQRWAPEAIAAIGPDGSTYGRACIAWPSRDIAIVRRSPDGTLLSRWGARGDGPGKFDGAVSLDVAADGTVWALDSTTDRVQAFDPDGRLLDGWGRPADVPEELSMHGPIAVTGDRIYVTGSGRIHRFQLDGTYVGTMRHAGAMANNPVSAMDVAPDGALFVLSEPSGRIERYDTKGVLSKTWGSRRDPRAPLTEVTRVMAAPGGGFLVLERDAFRIQRLDGLGAPVGTIDFSFLDEGYANDLVEDAAPSADGGVWLLRPTGEVIHLDADGAIQARWNTALEDLLGYGGALAVAPDGHLYISAFDAPWIHRFGPDGTALDGFGDSPDPPDGRMPNEKWLYPSIAPDGSVFITDFHPSFSDELSSMEWNHALQEDRPHRIRRFSAEGALLDSWLLEDLLGITDDNDRYSGLKGRAAVDGQGIFYLSIGITGSDPHIAAFSPEGEPQGRWWPGNESSSSVRLDSPAIDAAGRIAVPELHRGPPDRIHVFGPANDLGWRVSLFDNPHALGWPVTVTEQAAIDFDWGETAPPPLPSGQPYAARSERLLVSEGEVAELSLQVSGGARLWLDDRLLVDAWPAEGVEETVEVVLPSGPHRLRVDSVHRGNAAALHVGWTRRGDVTALFLPSLGLARPE